MAIGGFVFWADDGTPARPAETPTTVATDATIAPTAEPSPEQYPSIRVVGDLPFPDDVAMLVTTGGYAHGTGLPWRTRMIVGTENGPVVTAQVEPGPDDAQLMGIMSDPSGLLLAAVCSAARCASEGTITDVTTTYYRSVDGGARWQKVNERDGRWWPRLVVNGDLLAMNFDGMSAAAVFLGSNRAVDRPDAYAGLVSYLGAAAWISRTFPMLENADGSSLLKLDGVPVEGAVIDFGSDATGSRLLVTWTLPNGYDQLHFVSALADGRWQTFTSKIGLGRISMPLDDGTWLIEAEVALRPNTCTQDYAKDGDHGLSPAVFNPKTGDLAFFGAPFFSTGCAEGAERVAAIWKGDVRKVATPDDCLNLRAMPATDAVILDCLPDGALVLNGGSATESGGTRWVGVATLGGTTGWVALPYLVRP